MAIGGAFLGGGVEVVPAGSCKLELEILTEDRANLTATFTIKGTSTYTVTAGADGRAVYTVPAGQTYTVSVNTTGYDNVASQTVIAESGTVRYVRFEAFSGRVKRSGDTMTGDLVRKSTQYENNDFVQTRHVLGEYKFQDKNGVFSGYLRRVGTTASQFTQIGSVADINGATVSSSVEAHILPDGTTYANAPSWSVGTNDNSDKILTIKMANSLPSLVHTTGNETIAGDKTFSGLLQISNAISFKGNDTYPDFRIRRSGTNGVNLSLFIGGDATKPAITVNSSGNSITIGSDSVKAYGPATPSGATGNEIATADWALSKFQRKITYGTGDPPSGGQAGDIYIKI